MRKFLIHGSLAIAIASVTAGTNAGWQRAASPHFIIYADEKPEELRSFAVRLEMFDKAARTLRHMDDPAVGDGNRLTIYVVGDANRVSQLAKDKSGATGGFYIGRASGSIAVTAHSLGYSDDGDMATAAMTSQVLLFHEYAHHLMFSAINEAYPEWLVEGFAELLSTASFEHDGSIKIGTPPLFRTRILMSQEGLSLEKLLAGDYHISSMEERESIYGRGWLLTHYLTFEPSRQGQLATYLAQIGKGADSLTAARTAFGDLRKLDDQLFAYKLKQEVKAVRVLPAALAIGRVEISPLTAGAAAVMNDRIQSQVGVDKTTDEPLAERVRQIERRYPGDMLVEQTLAEAELDSRHLAASIAAADRALAVDPRNTDTLILKGRAIEAGSEPGRFVAARELFSAANKIDPEDPDPLSLFYYAYTEEGIPPPPEAIGALHYAAVLAPQDSGLRMNSAIRYLEDSKLADARADLLPLAYDPHGGEAAKLARSMITQIDGGDRAGALKIIQSERKATVKVDK